MEMIEQLLETTIPSNLHGPVLVAPNGLPRYWASIWSTMSAGHLASSTHTEKLRFIGDLYEHADSMFAQDALDDALAQLNEQLLSDILASWFVSIRSKSSLSAADEKRWQTGLGFAIDVVTWLAKSDVDKKVRQIEKRLQRMSILYKQLHVSKKKSVEVIRSLPVSVLDGVYEMLDPNSSMNPFHRQKTRWMIYVAFILMLRQGLRRGELLLLPVNAVHSAFDPRLGQDRLWLNIREHKHKESFPDLR